MEFKIGFEFKLLCKLNYYNDEWWIDIVVKNEDCARYWRSYYNREPERFKLK